MPSQENEDLRSKVLHLETTLQEKVEQLVYTKGHMDTLQWRREEETRHLEEKIQDLELSLESEKHKAPDVQVRAGGCSATLVDCGYQRAPPSYNLSLSL